jgi:hypothetical protein
MICAGESLSEGGATEVELAMVAPGAVGVALTVRLAGRIGRIALIKAGDTQFKPARDPETFKAASVDDEPYGGDAASRSIRKISRQRASGRMPDRVRRV